MAALPPLLLDDFLYREAAAPQLGLHRGQPREGRLSEPVALYLPSDGSSSFFYGGYGTLE